MRPWFLEPLCKIILLKCLLSLLLTSSQLVFIHFQCVWLLAPFLFSPFSFILFSFSPALLNFFFLDIFKPIWYIGLDNLLFFSFKNHSVSPLLFLAFCSSLKISIKVYWRRMELAKGWEEDLAFDSFCLDTCTAFSQWGSFQCDFLIRLEPSVGHHFV